MKKLFANWMYSGILLLVLAAVLPLAGAGAQQEVRTTRGANDSLLFVRGVDFVYQGHQFSWKDKIVGTGERLGPDDDYAPRITYYDKAKAYNGQWFLTDLDGDGYADDPHYITREQIVESQRYVMSHQLSGFKPALPGVDEKGETYQSYRKTKTYSRQIYDTEYEPITDIITSERDFRKALAEMEQIYTKPIPRNTDAYTQAPNWYYTNDVPADFPRVFWARIHREGRVMRVYVANGLGYRLACGYYATSDFARQYPRAAWSWEGADKALDGLMIPPEPIRPLALEEEQ